MFEEWPEEQKGWFQDAKAEEHHACVQLQQARRTLREARNRQHEIKMSRKFYRPGANTQNKGTGRGGGPVGMGTGARLPGHGPCFKCGAMGHKAAQCPQKESAQIVDEPEQAAEFTFFNEPKDAPENDCANTPEVLEVPEMALAAGELSVSPMVFMGHERKVSTEEAVRQGKAVIDGGATRTMGSLHALEMLEKQHQKQHGVSGVMHINPNEQPIFGFGNSQKSRCLSTCHMKLPSEQERQHEDPHLGSRRSTHPAECRQPPTHGRSDRLWAWPGSLSASRLPDHRQARAKPGRASASSFSRRFSESRGSGRSTGKEPSRTFVWIGWQTQLGSACTRVWGHKSFRQIWARKAVSE